MESGLWAAMASTSPGEANQARAFFRRLGLHDPGDDAGELAFQHLCRGGLAKQANSKLLHGETSQLLVGSEIGRVVDCDVADDEYGHSPDYVHSGVLFALRRVKRGWAGP
jgi:hypothetical protein